MTLGGLWFPPGARIVGRASVPEGNIVLGKRVIKFERKFGNPNPDPDKGELGNGSRWIERQGPTVKNHGLVVIATLDNTDRWGPLLHVSMSYSDHDPKWAEIRAIKDFFYGDLRDAMMILPKSAEYVNLHPHTFHLWECPEGWGIM